MSNILLILTLSVILAVTPFLAKTVRLPVTVIEMVLGFVAAVTGLIPENEYFTIIAEVGFLYLMFLAGLEINIRELFKLKASILQHGMVYLFLLYMFSVLAHFYWQLSPIFILIFPLISIGVVVTLLKDFPKDAPWLKLSLRIGVLGELVSIVGLTLASGVMSYGLSIQFTTVMISLALFLAAIIGVFYVSKILFWWFPELKTAIMPHSDNKEQDIRLSFSLFFIMVSLMLLLGLELALGAFIAGMFISSFFEHKKELPEKLGSFGFGFLVPIFFIHIGSTIEVDAFVMPGLLSKVALIVFVMFFIRVLSSLAFYGFLGLKGTVQFAVSQMMPLTLMIAVATLGYHAKSIDSLHYYAFVIASLIEVVLGLVFLKLASLMPEPKKMPAGINS